MLDQIDGTAIDERQQVSIEVRFGFLGRIIVDPMLAELLAWPLASITITVNLRAAIRPSREEAEGAKARIDDTACGGCCSRSHEVVDLPL